MNSIEFNNLLTNPEKANTTSPEVLESIIHEFPYFQAVKALQLKNFKNNNSFKYNEALKKTAAYTIDRKVLFEYITSLNFDKKTVNEIEILEEIEVIEPETVKVLHSKITSLFKSKKQKEEPILPEEKVDTNPPAISETNNREEIEIVLTNSEETKEANEVLELGKPLQFSSAEPHSFNEWMQLISQKPIEREEKASKTDKISSKIEDKFSLIDKFIETNPKIKPVDKQAVNVDISAESNYQSESLMTETLAKVYLEQKKYDNALQAYRILSLKYPEKSSFFANRIKAIKILQKNKS
ncbi:hypothetical protein [Lutibacter maritimus]|uniref:Tetratricopeptide repeat-containing protein n=1 Tax=Lutibacter maritimus TaxID=593133 RepID=A0A1I6R4X5_9FLAO|nr:hypothetical protein [Lutibacter maritimus]SFS59548.1 hypothetical protein SAMN04488006_2182 [Lutibacter maritimus]